jgi:hypothetical protein
MKDEHGDEHVEIVLRSVHWSVAGQYAHSMSLLQEYTLPLKRLHRLVAPEHDPTKLDSCMHSSVAAQ